jgi:hypothetical protein
MMIPLSAGAAGNPTIEIINYSKTPTATVEKWTKAGAAKLSDWQADTLGVIWDLGRFVNDRFSPDHPFNTHKVILSSSELKALTGKIKSWIEASECNDDPYRAEENKWGYKDIAHWIEGGADVATAPNPCYDRRIVLLGKTPGQDEKTAQQIWLHEFYHAHSNYLTNYCVNPNDSERDQEETREKHESQRWFGEGTAQYFATMVKAELNGVKDPVSLMLKEAETSAKRDGRELYANLARNSAVALRLLIEHGNIPNLEKDVMSGAVFHNCSWPDKWSSDKSAEVAFAQDNWFRIKKNGGKWSFTSAALKH